MVWGTSTVGYISGGNFPDIFVAGFDDQDDKDYDDIDIDRDDFLWGMFQYNPDTQEYDYIDHFFKQDGINKFTKTGTYDSDEISHPLEVAAVNFMGGASKEAIFVNGTIWYYNGDRELEQLYLPKYMNENDQYANATDLSNTQVESVAVGNFDNTPDGREQIIVATLLKQEGILQNNSYSSLYMYRWNGDASKVSKVEDMKATTHDKDSNNWAFRELSDYFISFKGKAYVTLSPIDTGKDSVLGKFKSVEKNWSRPDVLAILESTPYFSELPDTIGNSATQFSLTESSGQATTNTHSFSVGVHFAYSKEEVVDVEVTNTHSFTWSTMKSTNVEYTQDFENTDGVNVVACYRMPLYKYTFEDVSSGEEIIVEKAGTPAYSMIPVEEYNEQVKLFDNMEEITEGRGKMLGIPGDPFSYPSTQANLATLDPKTLDKSTGEYSSSGKNWIQYSGSGLMTQEYQYQKETEKEFEYEVAVEFDVQFPINQFVKLGPTGGYSYSYGDSKLSGSGITKSGSVQCISSKDFPNYDFQWKLAHWMVNLNGKKVPVIGYLVQAQEAPPSPPEGLTVATVGTDFAQIQWNPGSRSADRYNIYLVDEITDDHMLVGSVMGGLNSYEYTLSPLDPGEDYCFVVRGYSAKDGESVDSSKLQFTTNSTDDVLAEVGKIENRQTAPGGDVVFSSYVTNSGDATAISYQWQTRKPTSSATWTNVPNGKEASLTVSDVQKSQDGDQYRLIVTAVKNFKRYIYYSNVATLEVGKTPSYATGLKVEHADNSGQAGVGPITNPYKGQADYTTQEDGFESQEVTCFGTYTEGDNSYPVYEVKIDKIDNPIYVAVKTTAGSDKEAATTSYIVLDKSGTVNAPEFTESAGGATLKADTAWFQVSYTTEGAGGTGSEGVTTKYTEKSFDIEEKADGFQDKQVTAQDDDQAQLVVILEYEVTKAEKEEDPDTRTLKSVTPYFTKKETDAQDNVSTVYYSCANGADSVRIGTKYTDTSRDNNPSALTKEEQAAASDKNQTTYKEREVAPVYVGSKYKIENSKFTKRDSAGAPEAADDTTTKLYLLGSDGYYYRLTSSEGNSWEVDSEFQNITSHEVLSYSSGELEGAQTGTVSAEDVTKEPVTYTKSEPVETTVSNAQTGTKVDIYATLKSGSDETNSKAVDEGTGANFIITNLNSGSVYTVPTTTTDNNGTAMVTWSAPTAGLYSIRATVAGEAELASSQSETKYYQAGMTPATDKNDGKEYRLFTAQSGDDAGFSIVYGDSLTLKLQNRPATRNPVNAGETDVTKKTYTMEYGDWIDTKAEEKASYYIELVAADGTCTQLNPQEGATLSVLIHNLAAGTYTVRVWQSQEVRDKAYQEVPINKNDPDYDSAHPERTRTVLISDKEMLTAATVQVTRAKAQILLGAKSEEGKENEDDRKNLATNPPPTRDQIKIRVEQVGGSAEDFTPEKLEKYVKRSCDLYTDDGDMKEMYGAFVLSLGWSDEAEKPGYPDESSSESYRQYIEDRYELSFDTMNVERRQGTAQVIFSAGDGGKLACNYGRELSPLQQSDGRGTVSFGDHIQFVAKPNAGYSVQSWTINGFEYTSASSLPDGFKIIQMANGGETLDISSFNEGHTKTISSDTGTAKALTVSVTFTNQVAQVTYSVGGGTGTLSAATSNNTPINSGDNLAYGSTVVLTAKPGEGQMIDHWTVKSASAEKDEIYTWPGTEDYYRQETLTLENLTESVEVKVHFTAVKKTTVTYSMVTDNIDQDTGKGDNKWDQQFSGGTITATYDGDKTLITNGQVVQGTPITFTVTINQPDLNVVRNWQYRTNDSEEWTDITGSNMQNTVTINNPNTDKLDVRVLIDRAQTYKLSWEIKYQGAGVNQENSEAVLKVTSGGAAIETNGEQHTAHIPVQFALTLNPDYYVVEWKNATADSSDNRKATLEALTADTIVTVTVAEKPTVQLPTGLTGGTVTVTGTYDGKPVTFPHDGNGSSGENLHFDPNTTLTVTATPTNDYYVSKLQGETQTAEYGNKTETVPATTTNVDISVEFTEKPKITMPGSTDGGTITVERTLCGSTSTLTAPASGEDLHYDPGTEITVTMTPSKGYVPQIGETDAKTASNSDTYTATFNAAAAQDGIDLSTYKFRALDKITVHFFVISEGGYKGTGTEGKVAHGTLSADVSRKNMTEYLDNKATDGIKSDNDEDYKVDLYEGGSITLTAVGASGMEDTQTTAHNVDYWSIDKDNSFNNHLQISGTDFIDDELTRTYKQVKSYIGDENELFIGVCFSPSGAKISFGMAEGQETLGQVTAKIGDGNELVVGSSVGQDALVNFTGTITNDNYVVKYWLVGGEPQKDATELTFSHKADGRNMVVQLMLQGKELTAFKTETNGHGKASYTPSGDAVRYNESVTLKAEPDPGYEFDGWYYNGQPVDGATTADYVLTEPNDGTYTAHFKAKEGLSVAFKVSDDEGGSITATADGSEFNSNDSSLNGGQRIELTLKINDGYRQPATGEKWSNLPGDATVSDDGLTVIIPSLTDSITTPITANVQSIPEYLVTIKQPESTLKITAYIDGQPMQAEPFSVREGTEVTFRYSYVDGPSYVFSEWLLNDKPAGSENPLTVEVKEPITVSANTNMGLMYSLTIEKTDEAGASGNSNVLGVIEGLVADYGPGKYTLPKGSVITPTANPDGLDMVKEWYIDGVPQTTDGRTFLGLVLPEFTLDKDTTVKVVFESKAEYPNPTSEAGVYDVTNVTSYPSGENSGVSEGKYRKGGDLSFTIKPDADESAELLLPYIDGFEKMGDEVIVTENKNGGWDVQIKGVKGQIDLPTFRVKLENGIQNVPAGLKNQTVLEKLEKYLPEGVTTPEGLTGEVLTEVMQRIVVDEMPSAGTNNAVYDVELQKYEGGAWVPVTSADEFPEGGLTVILPYPEGTNRNDTFTVVHMFTVASTDGTHKPGDTETFKTDNGLTNTSMGLQFHVSSLSPIAVAWTKYAPPAGGGGGGGGGGAAATENPVTLPENVSNGSISSDKETAKEGAEVTLTVTPDWGYAPETVTVTDENGETVEVKDNGDGTYTFTMPATGVKVSVTFGSTCGRDETCPMYSFEDAVRTAWYHDGVHYCLEKGLMDGVGGGKFAPDRTTTRAMLVTILYRLEGEPAVTKNIPFEDVPAGQWYSDAVVWAAANGIVKGYNDTEFGPTDTVTREQMAAILYRYSEYKKYDVTATSDFAGYKDADTVSGWADAAMRWAVAEGLIEGTTKTTLVPGNGSTRAMVATVLMRYCEKIAK